MALQREREKIIHLPLNSADASYRGDSWRARVAHIPELQFNMVYQGMKIDFNGSDKYDWNERTRNLGESGTL